MDATKELRTDPALVGFEPETTVPPASLPDGWKSDLWKNKATECSYCYRAWHFSDPSNVLIGCGASSNDAYETLLAKIAAQNGATSA